MSFRVREHRFEAAPLVVGQRVRLVGLLRIGVSSLSDGSVGTIRIVHQQALHREAENPYSCGGYCVEFANGRKWWVRRDCLDLA